jgi:glutathione S-transferase
VLRLYTFHMSHFSEKARWALDYEGVRYQEKVLTPGPHQLVIRRIAPRSEVPVLQHDGHAVQGSSAILNYVADRLGCTKLVPASADAKVRAREVEATVDHAFGLGVQRVLYAELLKNRPVVVDLWSSGAPRWARAFYALAFPLVAAGAKRTYKTDDLAAIARAKQRFLAAFEELDRVLSRQPYLGGERPDRSDITVAALLAPVCHPPEHRVKWPETPPGLREFRSSLAGRPTWNHTLRMYREHRQPRG